MFTKKNKELAAEHEKLKSKYKSKKRGIFTVGASIGVLLTLGGHKLVKVMPVDKIKEQIEKVKEEVNKKLEKTEDQVEEKAEALEEILEDVKDEE